MTVEEKDDGYSVVNDMGGIVGSGFASQAEAWKWLDDTFEPVFPWEWYSADGVTIMDGLTRKKASWWKRLMRAFS